MGRVTARRPVHRLSPSGVTRRPDVLAVEEPLEIRVDGAEWSLTMRTPGNDIDLVHGMLLSEGVIDAIDDVRTIRYCAGSVTEEQDAGVAVGVNTYNVVDVTLARPTPLPQRNLLSNSACGVCGKSALDQVRVSSRFDIAAAPVRVAARTLAVLPAALRAQQRVFDATGGLHAAGLFTADGTLLAVREDVGRHNAVDKVVGWALAAGQIPAAECVLIVSGRASFELVQKAVAAGIPVLGAVSAPSSLAVDLAAETGITLVGFLRGDTMNVYTRPDRVDEIS